MSQITLKATEMKDAKVSFISLVERGANRIPFKIIKEDAAMSHPNKGFDLSTMRGLFTQKAEEVQAEILGVIAMKDDSLTSVQSQFEEIGFSVEGREEMDDGSVVFKQGDMTGTDCLVRVNDHSVLAVKGFRPYLMSMDMSDGSSFSEVCKSQGFFPGIGTLVDVMRSSIISVAEKSEDKDAAAKSIASMFDEAKTYVVGMVSSLPANAFKLESVYPMDAPTTLKEEEGDPAAADAPAAAAAEVAVAADAPAADAPAAEVAAKTDAELEAEEVAKAEEVIAKSKMSPEEKAHFATLSGKDKFNFTTASPEARASMMTKKSEGTVPEEAAEPKQLPLPLSEEQVSGIVGDKINKALEGVTTTLGGFAETLAAIQKSVVTATEAITAVQTQVVSVEAVAKAAKDAVDGVLVTGDSAGDHVPALKSETSRRVGGEIDTAFNLGARTRRNR